MMQKHYSIYIAILLLCDIIEKLAVSEILISLTLTELQLPVAVLIIWNVTLFPAFMESVPPFKTSAPPNILTCIIWAFPRKPIIKNRKNIVLEVNKQEGKYFVMGLKI